MIDLHTATAAEAGITRMKHLLAQLYERIDNGDEASLMLALSDAVTLYDEIELGLEMGLTLPDALARAAARQ